MKTASQFYVYVHHRPDGSPFYVGKGRLSRAYSFAPRNLHYKNVIQKYGADNISIRCFPCDSERHALDSEIALIAQLRGLGFSLTNMTDGGEGVSGLIVTEETRAKLSEARKGNKSRSGQKNSPQMNARISAASKLMHANNDTKNKHKSAMKEVASRPEVKIKRSAALKGNQRRLGCKCSEETRAKMSAAHKRRFMQRNNLIVA